MEWRSFHYKPPVIICQIFLVTLRTLYRYASALTRPVTIQVRTRGILVELRRMYKPTVRADSIRPQHKDFR